MKVDKKLFVVLTATLSGCVVNARLGGDPQTPPPPPNPNVAAPSTPGSTAAPGKQKFVLGQRTREAIRRGGASDPPAPSTEGGGAAPPAPSTEGGGAAPAPPVTPPAPSAEGGACTDASAAAKPPACMARGTAAECGKLTQFCSSLASNFKSKVAADVIASMNAVPGTDGAGCNNAIADGRHKVIAQDYCADTSVTQACTSVAAQCKTTPQECAKALAPYSQAGLQKLQPAPQLRSARAV